MKEYLAIDSSVYVYDKPLRINCSVAEWFPANLKWCLI